MAAEPVISRLLLDGMRQTTDELVDYAADGPASHRSSTPEPGSRGTSVSAGSRSRRGPRCKSRRRSGDCVRAPQRWRSVRSSASSSPNRSSSVRAVEIECDRRIVDRRGTDTRGGNDIAICDLLPVRSPIPSIGPLESVRVRGRGAVTPES